MLNRRDFLKLTAASAAAALLTKPGSGNAQPSGRPNLILLLTDDQRWDTLGCMGNPYIQTPALDSLAQNGTVFENAFVTTSICPISRASIFSGQYARRHGIIDFATGFSPAALADTYPIALRNAGYQTGFIGKYGVGEQPPAERFDYWRGFPGQGHYAQTDAQGNYRHLTQVMEDHAVDFLRSRSPAKPFCLSVSFKAPHAQDEDPRQFLYDPRDAELYKDLTLPTPKTADSFDAFPAFFKENNEGRRRWQARFSTPERYQEMVKSYYRLITGVDRAIGTLRTELQRLGLADNTVILFSSDNGAYLGEHGLADKWFGHEESIRVPLLVYDPRPQAKRGQRRTELVLNIDLAPTLLSLAALPLPARMQGRDLTPLTTGGSVAWRSDFLYEHPLIHPGIPTSEGVRTERYKYLRYSQQTPPYEELYDLQVDPHETTNLALQGDSQPLLAELRERCSELGTLCT